MAIAGYIFGALVAFILGLLISRIRSSTPSLKHCVYETPAFDVRKFFEGFVTGFAVIEDANGRCIGRYSFVQQGKVSDDVLTLCEVSSYPDGRSENRTWMLRLSGGNSLIIEGNDVVEQGEGIQCGNALHMRYIVQRMAHGKDVRFAIDERMTMIDESHVISKKILKKFGIKVACITASYSR